MTPQEAANYQQVAESVMRECIINLARIKETIGQSLASHAPSQGIDSVPTLVRGIKAGLMMLNKTRAMEVMERVGKLITLTLQGSGPSRLTQKETDRLADAIVSIEYYMETVKAGRAEPWYMLDNAEACLTVLRDFEMRLEQEEESGVPATTLKIPQADIEAQAAKSSRRNRQNAGDCGHAAARGGARCRAPRSGIARVVHRGGGKRRLPRSNATCRPGAIRRTTWRP